MRFQNKVVLIIGGNSGIGLASAIAFAKEGAKVVVTGRDPQTLTQAQEQIGHGARAIQSDIADIEATDKLMAVVGEEYARIDVLFINAGVGRFTPLEKVTPEAWDQVVAINLRGPYFAVQKALPLMQKDSAIVFTSSVAHSTGLPGASIYGLTKAGLRSMARNFGAELLERGIRVNCVSPGPIETPIFKREHATPEQVSQVREMMRSQVPMKRLGTSEEVAAAVLFLASAEASFITGTDLLVDGGVLSF